MPTESDLASVVSSMSDVRTVICNCHFPARVFRCWNASGSPGGGAGEAVQKVQSCRAAGPMAIEGARPGPADDGAQDEGNDEDVVGVADHGYEVGHEVDRRSEVDQEQDQPYTHPAGNRLIGGEPSDKAEQIWQQPQRVAHADGVGMAACVAPQQRKQHEIDQQYAGNDTEQGLPPHQPSAPFG